MNKLFTIVVTMTILSLNVIRTSPVKTLHKRSADENLYHAKNYCILACGECAEEDLNDMNEEVRLHNEI
jgi:hypothetical protein